jgi:hypothetical protein
MEDRSSWRVRTLVTLTARRGLSANKIACALISMMARSTTRSKGRPDTLMQDRITQRRAKPLAPRGRGELNVSKSSPLCSVERTSMRRYVGFVGN